MAYVKCKKCAHSFDLDMISPFCPNCKTNNGMNAELKYYTPVIGEFHIGFEFEYLSVEREWVKTVMVISNDARANIDGEMVFGLELKTIDKMLNMSPSAIRVNILNDEDITLVGWVIRPNSGSPILESIMAGIPSWVMIDGSCEIKMTLVPNGKFHIRHVGKHHDDTLFLGDIRSKSELKKVMRLVDYVQ